MKLCRYTSNGHVALGFFWEDALLPLEKALETEPEFKLALAPYLDNPLRLLPGGEGAKHAEALWERVKTARSPQRIPLQEVRLLPPIPLPGKILLLAGNYVEHLLEEGSLPAERTETFPYVFSKPPTTLHASGQPITIPACSPDHIDYEGELAIVIGREAKSVTEDTALDHVAGYTVVNDVSDRKFRPFPNRKPRERDAFFDWLHGKWHDQFCPAGPCIVSAAAIPDPQTLSLETRVNGEKRQSTTTAKMIFPVTAIIAFLSQWMTLYPGDLIVTGTPAGVGMTTSTYLQPGDIVEVEIEGIGTLTNAFTA